MKAVVAQKGTTCSWCEEPISAGEERLTDTIQVGVMEGKPKVITKHYHFRANPDALRSCYDEYAEHVLANKPHIVTTNNPNGRPKLDLTKEQMKRRVSLLRSLSNQSKYYLVGDNKLDFTPRFITEMTVEEVRRGKRFTGNIKRILEELESLGGVPPKWKEVLPSFKQSSVV